MIRKLMLVAALLGASPARAMAMTVPPVDFRPNETQVYVGIAGVEVDRALTDRLSVGAALHVPVLEIDPALRATYRLGRFDNANLDYGLTAAVGTHIAQRTNIIPAETTIDNWALIGLNLTLSLSDSLRLRALIPAYFGGRTGVFVTPLPTGEVGLSLLKNHEVVLGYTTESWPNVYFGWRGHF